MDAKEDDIVFTMKICKDGVCDITNEDWENIMFRLRQFLRWIKTNERNYFFVFDMHLVSDIPVNRMIELQVYLKKKRELLKRFLNCTVIITSSSFVKTIIETAFAARPPVRPVHTIVCSREVQDVERLAWEYF